MAQLTDLHLDEYTEPFFLRDAVGRINRLNPDAVFLTGDFVTHGLLPKRLSIGPAWQCANLLNQLQCQHRYAILGNHDVIVGRKHVVAALTANSITVLDNAYLPLERAGARFWLAGLDDPVEGKPDPDAAIPLPFVTCRMSPSFSCATRPIMSMISSRSQRAEPSPSCLLATPTAARFACR